MVGWQLCREKINTPLAHFAIDCNNYALENHRDLLGNSAIVPTICTNMSKHYVGVECEYARLDQSPGER